MRALYMFEPEAEVHYQFQQRFQLMGVCSVPATTSKKTHLRKTLHVHNMEGQLLKWSALNMLMYHLR